MITILIKGVPINDMLTNGLRISGHPPVSYHVIMKWDSLWTVIMRERKKKRERETGWENHGLINHTWFTLALINIYYIYICMCLCACVHCTIIFYRYIQMRERRRWRNWSWTKTE